MLKRLTVICLVILVAYACYLNYVFSHRSLLSAKTPSLTTVKVYPGFHIDQLARELKAQKLWLNPGSFVVLAMLHGYGDQLHFGEYTVTPGMSASELLHHIASATGMAQYHFRIGEGVTLKKVMLALAANPAIFKTKNPLQLSSFPPSLEGFLYPDTYQFVWGVKDSQVLRMAYATMLKKQGAVWVARDPNIPIHSAYELLIVASLIETEASNLKERPLIAGVIYNRLHQHMRLQIDPTVTYGLGLPYGSSLVDPQLKIKTPYNTYIIAGLPPTPIAMPSLASLQAAAHPAKTEALYYMADGKGSHVFSKTYAEHEQAVARYHAFILQQTDKVIFNDKVTR